MTPVSSGPAFLSAVRAAGGGLHLVHLYPAVDPSLDAEIERMVSARSAILCKGEVSLSRRGLLNCKKISYSWQGDWVGTPENSFAGLRKHVKKSIRGRSGPTRVYAVEARDISEMVALKAEIRALAGLGTWPCHITDTREEALALAAIYFNENALLVWNGRGIVSDTAAFDARVDALKARLAEHSLPLDGICGAGSTVLSAMGLRRSRDFDYLALDSRYDVLKDGVYSPHDSQLRYYPAPKERIIEDPALHFVYRGVKIASPDVVLAMKRARGEWPKDWKDALRIVLFRAKSRFLARHAAMRLGGLLV